MKLSWRPERRSRSRDPRRRSRTGRQSGCQARPELHIDPVSHIPITVPSHPTMLTSVLANFLILAVMLGTTRKSKSFEFGRVEQMRLQFGCTVGL